MLQTNNTTRVCFSLMQLRTTTHTDHDLWRQLYVAQFGPIPPQTEHNFQALLQRSSTYPPPACAARAVVRVRRVRRVRSWLTGLVWVSVTLRAELEAKERLAERRQAKLVVQTVHHPHCDHRHHDLQAEMPAFYGQHPGRWRGSSLVVAFDASTKLVRVTPCGYYWVNDCLKSRTHQLAPACVRVRRCVCVCVCVCGGACA